MVPTLQKIWPSCTFPLVMQSCKTKEVRSQKKKLLQIRVTQHEGCGGWKSRSLALFSLMFPEFL